MFSYIRGRVCFSLQHVKPAIRARNIYDVDHAFHSPPTPRSRRRNICLVSHLFPPASRSNRPFQQLYQLSALLELRQKSRVPVSRQPRVRIGVDMVIRSQISGLAHYPPIVIRRYALPSCLERRRAQCKRHTTREHLYVGRTPPRDRSGREVQGRVRGAESRKSGI